METIRKFHINRIKVEIRETEQNIVFAEKSLISIREVENKDLVYVKNQIGKYTTSIANSKHMIEEAEKRIDDIVLGLMDDDFKASSATAAEVIKRNKKIQAENDMMKKQEQHVNAIKLKHHNKGEYKANEKEMDRSLTYFFGICDSLPPFMETALKGMPNNKGYIWRGCHFYGLLSYEDSETTSLFEPKKGFQFIHEWDDTSYRVFRKTGKEPKELVSEERRYKK